MAPLKSPVRVVPESDPADGNVVRLYQEGSMEATYTALMALYGLPFASSRANRYADAAVLDFKTALSIAEQKDLRRYKAMVEAGMQLSPEIEAAGKAAEAKKDATDKAALETARKAAVVRDTIDL